MNAVTVDYLEEIENLSPETPLVLTGVGWDEYVRISDEIGERPGLRVTYDQGRLEIMSLSPEHESSSRLFTHLISVLTDELDTDYLSFGSMTLRKKAILGAVEADDCYYIGEFDSVANIKRLGLSTMPPPDLAIEVDVSHGSRGKFRIYAGLRVKELWRYAGKRLEFYSLAEDRYVKIEKSILFPFLSSSDLPEFISIGKTRGVNAMRRALRTWVQANRK